WEGWLSIVPKEVAVLVSIVPVVDGDPESGLDRGHRPGCTHNRPIAAHRCDGKAAGAYLVDHLLYLSLRWGVCGHELVRRQVVAVIRGLSIADLGDDGLQLRVIPERQVHS